MSYTDYAVIDFRQDVKNVRAKRDKHMYVVLEDDCNSAVLLRADKEDKNIALRP